MKELENGKRQRVLLKLQLTENKGVIAVLSSLDNFGV